MDLEEKENPEEKIDGYEKTDLQIEDTGGGETNFQTKPKNVDYITKPKLLSTTDFGPYFTRGCKWSPDGLCILVCSDDHNLRIFDLPPNDKLEETKDQSDKLAKAAVDMKEGESVYDYHWYPLMNSTSPETCCLATTSQHQPIHLYDAFDGHIRATYR